MTPIHERLKGLAFFRQLDSDAVEMISRRGLWFSLAGGWDLFKQDTFSQTLFFVLSGRLVVVREGPNGEEVIGYVRAGEPVGEMSLLSGEPHSASVYALRDTELLALPRADFEAVLEESADFASALARSVLLRSRHPTTSLRNSSPRVFALIASSPSIDLEARARRIASEVERYGLKTKLLSEDDADHVFYSFEAQENAHDVLLMVARVSDSPWYKFVLRHADRFFVFARRDARPPRPFPLSPTEDSPARRFRLVDLVMLEEGMRAASVADWVDAIGANRIFHWRGDDCLGRLARVIGGRSIGVVFSGGGARAYAHIGVAKAMREKGLPVDFACGASMGGIIAACLAIGWSNEEIDERIKDAFVSSNPLGDHVLPVVALTKGAIVDERLARHFSDTLIEELELPFFCVSSELVRGVARVHRMGSLRQALRASISLPGILPPVVDGDALLVDGAVINNFPTAMMTAMHRGITIGVDVAEEATISAADFVQPGGFMGWVRRHGLKSAPPIISLLMRAATAREEGTRRTHPADLMITPKVAGVELRDWKKYDIAVADGYREGIAAIEARWADLGPIAEAARPG